MLSLEVFNTQSIIPMHSDSTRSQHATIILLILAIAFAALTAHFIQDDAFISFRYAKNLADGKGLVWNQNEHIEGYTNFLWTLSIAVGIKLGFDPGICSQVFGLLAFLGTLITIYRATHLIGGFSWLPTVVLMTLATNYTFLAYATGGLETQLQTCLLVVSFYLVLYIVKKHQIKLQTFLFLSLTSAGAILTRLDSAVIVTVLYGFLSLAYFGRWFNYRWPWLALFVLIFPAISILGTWMMWRLSFYGDLFPNTFYVKTSSSFSITNGLLYVYEFMSQYAVFPFVIIGLAIGLRAKSIKRETLLMLTLILSWFFYVIWAGGDFMEFRFLVPVIPILYILISLAFSLTENRLYWALILVGLATMSGFHFATFGLALTDDVGIEGIRALNRSLFDENAQWINIGKRLHDYFAEGQASILIAVTPAGAIPYYSELNTLDMYGLNDKYIARYASLTVTQKPGHQKLALPSYLVQRHVNLIIGHPQILEKDKFQTSFDEVDLRDFRVFVLSEEDELPLDARIVEIPIDEKYKLRCIYMFQNDVIDERIKENGWQTFPIVYNFKSSYFAGNPTR